MGAIVDPKPHVHWNEASIFATLLAIASIGAAAAGAMGHVEVLLPVDVFGKLDPVAGSLLAVQCFAIGVLTLCSVYNNYAPSQLKFHALGLLPVIVLGISFGNFWANVIQNTIVFALCAYFGFTFLDGRGAATAASGTLATILMGINLLLMVAFCATPFFMSVAEIFPQFEGKVSTPTFHMCIASTVVYVVPLAAAVLSNKASQVQPWWAACLFFNAATHMMMDPVDTQNAMTNGVLAVVHMSSALFCGAKAAKTRTG